MKQENGYGSETAGKLFPAKKSKCTAKTDCNFIQIVAACTNVDAIVTMCAVTILVSSLRAGMIFVT